MIGLLLETNQICFRFACTCTHTKFYWWIWVSRLPLDVAYPSIPGLCILLGQSQTLFPHWHCSTKSSSDFLLLAIWCFIVIQWWTQSSSSLCSTCQNHLNLPFLITKLTGFCSSVVVQQILLHASPLARSYCHVSSQLLTQLIILNILI